MSSLIFNELSQALPVLRSTCQRSWTQSTCFLHQLLEYYTLLFKCFLIPQQDLRVIAETIPSASLTSMTATFESRGRQAHQWLRYGFSTFPTTEAVQGCSVRCKICSSIPGLWPLEANIATPSVVAIMPKCSLVGKITLFKNHWTKVKDRELWLSQQGHV